MRNRINRYMVECMKRLSNRVKIHSGMALLELALVVPILTLLIGGGIDLTRMLSQSTSAVSLSRELGADAFRQCTMKLWYGPIPDTTKIRACLDKVVAPTASEIPGARVIVSIYIAGPPGELPILVAAARTSGFNASTLPSRKSVQDFSDYHSLLGRALVRNYIIVYSEVFLPKHTLLGNWWNNLVQPGNEIYASTLL